MAEETGVQTIKAHFAINVRDVAQSIEFYGGCSASIPLKPAPGTRSST
jgi:hypothetical protein